MTQHAVHVIVALGVLCLAATAFLLTVMFRERQPLPQPQGQTTRVVQSAYGLHLPVLGDVFRHAIDTLNVGASSALDVRGAGPGEIVPVLDMEDAVKQGKLWGAFTGLSYSVKSQPVIELYTATPFGMRPLAFLSYMLTQGGLERLNRIAGTPNGLYYYPMCLLPPETGGWVASKAAADALGQPGTRMRIYGLARTIIEDLGGQALMLPIGDIAAAAQDGRINAAEASILTIDEALGLQDHFAMWLAPAWNQSATLLYFVMKDSTWQALGPDTRAHIQRTLRLGLYDTFLAANAAQAAAARARPPYVLPAVTQRRLRDAWHAHLAAEPAMQHEYEAMMAYNATFSSWQDMMLTYET